MNLISKSKIKHDGKWYEPGEEMASLKKEDGKRLVDLGVAYAIEEKDKEVKIASTPPVSEDDEDDEDEDDEEVAVVKPKRQRKKK